MKAVGQTLSAGATRTKDAAMGVLKAGSSIADKVADTVSDKVSKHVDAVVESQARKIVEKIEGMALKTGTPPYMPWPLIRLITRVHDFVWEHYLTNYLVKMIVRDFGSGSLEPDKEEQLKYWAAAPVMCLCGSISASCVASPWRCIVAWARQLLVWLRCKFLYATMPADGNIFKVLRLENPVGIAVFALKLHDYAALGFAATFLLMDRTDEYQLVAFLLKFKGFQFFTGLYHATKHYLRVLPCLEAIEQGTPQFCLDNSAGASPVLPYVMALEVMRVVMCWSALYLLLSGRAFGGEGELRALHHVRVDAADGVLGRLDAAALERRLENARAYEPSLFEQLDADRDGTVCVDDLAELLKSKLRAGGQTLSELRDAVAVPVEKGAADAMRAHAPAGAPAAPPAAASHAGTIGDDEEESAPLLRRLDDESYASEVMGVREALGVGEHEARGGLLPYFVLYDAAVLIGLSGFYIAHNLNKGWGPADPLFWSSLYNMRVLYALSTFPFLLFSVPILGSALHGAKPTGYDEDGRLAPMLSSAQKRHKYELELEEARKAAAERNDRIHAYMLRGFSRITGSMPGYASVHARHHSADAVGSSIAAVCGSAASTLTVAGSSVATSAAAATSSVEAARASAVGKVAASGKVVGTGASSALTKAATAIQSGGRRMLGRRKARRLRATRVAAPSTALPTAATPKDPEYGLYFDPDLNA